MWQFHVQSELKLGRMEQTISLFSTLITDKKYLTFDKTFIKKDVDPILTDCNIGEECISKI